MSEFYKVVAPLVLVKDEDGRITYAYEDAIVRLTEEQAEHFLSENLVEETDFVLDDGGIEKPPRDANKPVLVEWLVENVSKDDGSDYTAEELDKLNKDQLWELIDSVE